MMSRYKPLGWRNDNYRHSLAARGLTKRISLAYGEGGLTGFYDRIKSGVRAENLSGRRQEELLDRSLGSRTSLNPGSIQLTDEEKFMAASAGTRTKWYGPLYDILNDRPREGETLEDFKKRIAIGVISVVDPVYKNSSGDVLDQKIDSTLVPGDTISLITPPDQNSRKKVNATYGDLINAVPYLRKTNISATVNQLSDDNIVWHDGEFISKQKYEELRPMIIKNKEDELKRFAREQKLGVFDKEHPVLGKVRQEAEPYAKKEYWEKQGVKAQEGLKQLTPPPFPKEELQDKYIQMKNKFQDLKTKSQEESKDREVKKLFREGNVTFTEGMVSPVKTKDGLKNEPL